MSNRIRRSCIVYVVSILSCVSVGSAQTVLFEDDFGRADSGTVGNGWVETESGGSTAAIAGNDLRFNPADNANRPMVQHSFAEVAAGTLTFEFELQWNRSGNENDYELWIQLGDSDAMVDPGTSDSTGVGVNLKWAGTNHGMDNHEGFGYVSNGGSSTTQVAVVSGSTDIEIVANLSSYTYEIIINGSSVATGVPFDNNVPLNSIRIYANIINQSNFDERDFDNIVITQEALFTDVSAATGFNVQTTTAETYSSGFFWADFDDDGDLDCIVLGNSARLLVSASEGASFFVSSLGGRYRDGALLDIDNDGDVDFWSGCDGSYDNEALLENNGLASFTDEGNMGFSEPSNNEGLAAADANLDGWCDIVMFSENGNWIGTSNGGDPIVLSGSDASSLGLNDSGDDGNGDFCSSGDVNGDGYLDFFYHWSSGKLFLSDGDGTYTENNSGISVVTGNSDKFGSAFGDYDNDGDLDLFVPRYDNGSRGYLWRNDSGTFTDVTVAAGISNTASQRSAAWGDYDNDGDLDLYITTTSGDNVLYSNDGDGTFTQVNANVAASGNGHDAVFVDYDNDGDLDLAVAREDTTNMLLRNDLDNDEYLKVRVVGSGAGGTNVACIGTRVDLYDATGTTLLARRDVGVARGFGGQEPLWLHFGGVDPDTTYVVRVHFVSGTVDTSVVPSAVSTTIGAVTIDQMVTIAESAVEPLRLIRWQERDPIP